MKFFTKIALNFSVEKTVRTIVCVVGVCFLATLTIALPQQALAQADDSRVALVIGNDNYAKDPLKNAVNDARRVAETLIALNFRVVLKLNANLDDMNSATVEFARLLPDARAAVFFYAGHGLQRNQKNYLVPIGANIASDLEIKSKTFEASTVLDYMDESRVSNKILILDACRNNPFKGEFVLSETGLASMRTSSGTVIAFAAKPGAVAFDAGANEENGLYTKHLLREMVKPNLQSILMFENVSRAVQQESGGKQVPEALSSPSAGKRAFFFVEGAAPPLAQIAPGNTGAARSQSVPSGPTGFDLQAAQEMWSFVKNSNQPEDYLRFLKEFPTSPLASAAKFRLESLQRAQVTAQPLNSAQTSAPAVLVAEPIAAPVPAPVVVPVLPAAAPIEIKPTVVPPPAVGVVPATAPTKVTVSVPPPVVVAPIVAPVAPSLPVTIPPPVAQPILNTPSAVTPPALVVAPSVPAVAVPVVAKPNPIQNGRIEFTKDEYYEGQFKELPDKSRVLHGPGEFVAKSFRYKGDFIDNKKQGRGEYIWENGDKYDGDWVADTQSGNGKWSWASGDRYQGQVKDSIIVGEGEYFFAKSGDSFKGSFLAGKPHGKGVYQFSSGDKYEGEMQAGVQSGRGIYSYKSGDRIDGLFVNNNANGRGVYYFANGNRYEGDLVGGGLTGKGVLMYANGNKYEGDFVAALPKGQGEFSFSDGSVFIGNFENGTSKATGVQHNKDGTKYDADMVNSQVIRRAK